MKARGREKQVRGRRDTQSETTRKQREEKRAGEAK